MFKKILGWLLDSLSRALDRQVGPDDIRTFIQTQYQRLNKKPDISPETERDLMLTAEIMADLGWLEGYAVEPVREQNSQIVYDLDVEWFGKQGLAPGAGKALDWLDNRMKGKDQRALIQLMDRILRHVEVRREKSLRKFTQAVSFTQAWMERCDVSILFSRFARRHHDLCFLNGALKMNEWYLKLYNASATDEMTARLLLALAEQEKSAKELMTC